MRKKTNQRKKSIYILMFITFIACNASLAQNTIWQFNTNTGHSKPAWVEELCLISDVSGNNIQEVVAGTHAYGEKVFCIEGKTGDLLWDYEMLISHPVGDLLTISDVNNNGTQDILVAEGFVSTVPPTPPSGPKIICLDGGSGQEIWTYIPSPQGYIQTINLFPDQNNDGIPEIIAGSNSAWIAMINGSNGSMLWSTSITESWIQAISLIEDVNNDGVADVLAANIQTTKNEGGQLSTNNNRNQIGAYCFSGSDGSIIWENPIGSIQRRCIKNIQDINNDGIEDAICGTFSGEMHALSGADGSCIWTETTPTADFIQEVKITPDINGNGIDEIIACSWDDFVYCFDGASGSLLWDYETANFVHTISISEDITGDGVHDILAGDRGNGIGSAYCISGKSGDCLWSFPTNDMVWAVIQIEDVNSNGVPDVVAGSDDGQVYCIEGNQYIGTNVADKQKTSFSKCFPNPFSDYTIISFQTFEPEKPTCLTIYDINSKRIKQLINKKLSTGSHSIQWNRTDNTGTIVPPGIYTYRIQNGNYYDSKCILLTSPK